jgi:hypothetical protein
VPPALTTLAFYCVCVAVAIIWLTAAALIAQLDCGGCTQGRLGEV